MSGGTTTDAARLKVGDRLRVSFEGVVDRDGDFKATGGTYSYVGTPTREPATPADLVELYGALLEAINPRPVTPAPYTEPRDGDEVEVEQKALRGVVTINPEGLPFCDGRDGSEYINCSAFRKAIAEDRVRLVQAAAPTYEPGTLYRAPGGDLYEFLPDLAPGYARFRLRGTNVWGNPAGDLVPCDVVPREAT